MTAGLAINRKVFRQNFATLLQPLKTGAGGHSVLVAEIYDYNVSDFGNNAPVIVLRSAASGRPVLTGAGASLRATLEAVVFVRYAHPGVTTWKEEQSEDRLDDIEAAIAAIVQANRKFELGGAKIWDDLRYVEETATGSTEIEIENIGGVAFRIEVIRMIANVYADRQE